MGYRSTREGALAARNEILQPMAREGEHGSAGSRASVVRRGPSKRQLAVFAGYVAAAAVYIAIGVYYTDFLLSVFVGIAYLLLVAWLVPAGVRRLF